MASLTEVIRYIFLLPLLFAPLAFGTVEVWSLGVLEALCFGVLASAFFGRRRSDGFSVYNAPGFMPLVLLLCFMLVQAIPLPGGIADSLNRKASFEEFFLVAACGAFYLLTVQLLAGRDSLKKTTIIITAFASLFAFGSIVQFLLPGN